MPTLKEKYIICTQIIRRIGNLHIGTFLNSQMVLGMSEGEIAVEVLVDNVSLGRTSFIIRSKMQLLSDLMDDVINPVDFICSTLDTNNAETLDMILCEKFTSFKTNRIPMFGIENYHEENPKVFGKFLLKIQFIINIFILH